MHRAIITPMTAIPIGIVLGVAVSAQVADNGSRGPTRNSSGQSQSSAKDSTNEDGIQRVGQAEQAESGRCKSRAFQVYCEQNNERELQKEETPGLAQRAPHRELRPERLPPLRHKLGLQPRTVEVEAMPSDV
jgi:hypothetical protein